MIIEALILQSRFDLLAGNLRIAFKKLDNALSIADMSGSTELIKKVEMEKKSLNEELNLVQELIQSDYSIYNQLEKLRFKEYLQNAEIMKIKFEKLID